MPDWLDDIGAQADETTPYYLPRLVAEIRRLRAAAAPAPEGLELVIRWPLEVGASYDREGEPVGIQRHGRDCKKALTALDELLRARPALSDYERAESLRSLRWIKEFCEAHHSGEAAAVHLHRLLVDVPHYLDYVIAVLDGPAGGARGEADARERDAGTPQSTGTRPAAPLSDETLRELASVVYANSERSDAVLFAAMRVVLARVGGQR